MTEVIRVPSSVIELPDPPERTQPGDLNDSLINTSTWTDEMVTQAGIPIVDVQFVTIGGGIGSFIMVDFLRVAGVSTDRIKVLTNIETPWQTYEYLTRVSQIPRQERLRSDSTGMPDNLWAFPSYAWRESRQDKNVAALWSVLVEPIFTDYWTPRAATVFEGIEKEAHRVRWEEMVTYGQVRMVRKRVGGGYFVILTPAPNTTPTKRVAYRAQYVHISVGYPGLRFLPDLQEYRQKYHDVARIVNAYEPHEHVYQGLQARPGTVLVRGGGIVASRVLQRLMEDRWNHGAQTTIVHIFRTYIDGKNAKYGPARRKGASGFAFQGFNVPKGSWGGQLRDKFSELEGDQRAELYRAVGGTHTPHRKLWLKQMARARTEGWYQTFQGEVIDVAPTASGRVGTRLRQKSGGEGFIEADVVIDCTGLEADLAEHRVLADLLQHSGAGRNVLNRLDVERTFEIRGTRNGSGRIYASGAATQGGYYAGVDSFLGMQYTALRIGDDLAEAGFGERIGGARALRHWWKSFRHKII